MHGDYSFACFVDNTPIFVVLVPVVLRSVQ